MSAQETSDGTLSLAGDFPPATHDQWLKLVDKILGGAPFDKKLVSRTYDGIALQPLYTRADWTPDDTSGLPKMPGTAAKGWDIRPTQGHPDPATANAGILKDLERGASSIALKVDAGGAKGTTIRALVDLDRALKDVLLDMAPVVLEAASPPLPYAALLLALLENRGIKADAFTGNFGLDPLNALATSGQLVADLETAYARVADAAAYIAKAHPKARGLNVNTVAYHSAGAAEAQELGCALGTAAEYLRALTHAGMSIDAACGQIAFTIAVDADFFLGIAKLRALRKLWARVAEACGANAESRIAPITACTAPRMMSQRDPWVNMLRTTVACFAAGVGGADAVTVLPFDNALGLPSELGRRVARNTQVLLQEEAHIAKVIDPAGGAWMFEKLTDDLAEKAWSVLQDIEKQGGMGNALISGFVAAKIAAVQTARATNIAKRKDAITGVSEFPHVDEVPVESIRRAPTSGDKAEGIVPLTAPGQGAFMESLVKAARGGANIAAMVAALGSGKMRLTMTPLPCIRLAEDFEKLRDASDTFKAAYGQRPKVFLAAIGTSGEFTARAAFAKNFFEAGGIAAVPSAGGTEIAAIVRDFTSSGAGLAIICSTDALYVVHATHVAKALKDAGAATVYLAGRGGDLEATLKSAGVDDFIFVGCDAKTILEGAHQRLKVGR